jgi:hypothetical protein
MSETREAVYLRQVLALDPQSDAAEMLRLRRDYLQPSDVVMAHIIDDDDVDLRLRMLRLLADVRLEFWTMPADHLLRQLAALTSSGHAETAAAATRLLQIAQQRASLIKLRSDTRAHRAFVDTLTQVLLSTASEANRQREREQRWMRPSTNANYKRARYAIQATVRVIQANYPEVFALEEAWLSELLEYNPEAEVESEGAQQAFGLLVFLLLGVMILLMYTVVRGVFG